MVEDTVKEIEGDNFVSCVVKMSNSAALIILKSALGDFMGWWDFDKFYRDIEWVRQK